MVLLATAGRPIRFLMAKEIYFRIHIRWVFEAFRCIPVQRGRRHITAIRTMLEGLAAQEVWPFPKAAWIGIVWMKAIGHWLPGDKRGRDPGVFVWDGHHSDLDTQNAIGSG